MNGKNSINIYLIFIQSLIAMLWSLYFSNYGDPLQWLFSGTWFEPCHLCRWTRILMYPIVRISLTSIITKNTKSIYTILPISIAGMLLSGYHYTIQHINSLNAFTCNPSNPCTLIDWKMLEYITIPSLAFIAFLVIFVLSISYIRQNSHNSANN